MVTLRVSPLWRQRRVSMTASVHKPLWQSCKYILKSPIRQRHNVFLFSRFLCPFVAPRYQPQNDYKQGIHMICNKMDAPDIFIFLYQLNLSSNYNYITGYSNLKSCCNTSYAFSVNNRGKREFLRFRAELTAPERS